MRTRGRAPFVEGLKGRLVRAAGRVALRRDLHAVHMRLPDEVPHEDAPVLYVSNHATWWDGFLVQRVHDGWRTGPLMTVVEEASLLRFPALAAAGCVGVDRTSLTSVRSLLRTVARHSETRGVGVSLFPQGRIHSSRRRPLGFERGMGPVARAMGSPVVVPVAIHAELLNRRRPTVFLVVGEPYPWKASKGVSDAEGRVSALLDQIQRDFDERGESVAQGWEERMKITSRTVLVGLPENGRSGEGASA